jgi:hypothetical protein
MAGVFSDEGDTLCATVVCKKTSGDRDSTLELGLFTNSSVSKATTHAALTEPSGTGYARIVLTDASWTVTGPTAAYAKQTFTAGAGGWSGTVKGYFINTVSAGGTKRLLMYEVDANGPFLMTEAATYAVTPNLNFL